MARPKREPGRHAPVFVLAFPRSCSSVVATMLGQNPGLAGLPETKLFLYPRLGQLESALPRALRECGVRHRSPGLVRAVAQLIFGGQSETASEAALAWLGARGEWTGANVFDALLDVIEPHHAVEKSPEHVTSTAALRRVVTAYPRARFVHLVRHPLTTCTSVDRHWQRSRFAGTGTMPPIGSVLRSWVEVQRRLVALADTLGADRMYRIRAEDILADPCEHLVAVAEWLGVRHDEDAVQRMVHPENSPFAALGPEGLEGGLDPSFLGSPSLRRHVGPGAGGSPTWPAIGGALGDELAAVAGMLGYAVPSVA